MITCIWCNRNSNETSFNLIAHLLPKKLGSKETYKEECDECNKHFGQRISPKHPSIDIALKETFILSRYQQTYALLQYQDKFGKRKFREIFGKNINSNTSSLIGRETEFFKLDLGKKRLKTKRSFRHHQISPYVFTNQLRRGLLKVGFAKAHITGILEYYHGGFYSDYYNYIRDYVSKNIGNTKLVYLAKKNGIILTTVDRASNTKVIAHEIENNFLRFEILGHTFAASLGKLNLTEHNFRAKYYDDIQFEPREIMTFMDIDIFNSVFGRQKSHN